MTLPPLMVASARRHLEAVYGLALEGVGDEQIAAAVAAAAEDPWVEPSEPRFLARVVDRLPIDESWLFREDGLWEWLRDEAGPSFLDAALAASRPVRILSLGCSAGQEPFSAAMLFQGLLERGGIPASAAASFVQVLGLDPSAARVEAARAGVVPGWSVQRARPDWLGGRVAAEDAAGARWRVDPTVRAMCRFEVGNVLDVAARGNAALAGFDLVLCRHVLIYFRPVEAERIAARLAESLDPGAVLVFSATEAHLLAPRLSPLRHVGAGRAGAAFGERPRAACRPGGRRRPPGPAARALGTPAPSGTRNGCAVATPAASRGGAAPVANGARGEAVASHLRVALEHAHAGRSAEALREARAALFHDPRHLYSRLLVGQHLIRVDAARGREILRDLLASAAALPADAEVPCAEGLSVAQLEAAAKLLLDRQDAR